MDNILDWVIVTFFQNGVASLLPLICNRKQQYIAQFLNGKERNIVPWIWKYLKIKNIWSKICPKCQLAPEILLFSLDRGDIPFCIPGRPKIALFDPYQSPIPFICFIFWSTLCSSFSLLSEVSISSHFWPYYSCPLRLKKGEKYAYFWFE